MPEGSEPGDEAFAIEPKEVDRVEFIHAGGLNGMHDGDHHGFVTRRYHDCRFDTDRFSTREREVPELNDLLTTAAGRRSDGIDMFGIASKQRDPPVSIPVVERVNIRLHQSSGITIFRHSPSSAVPKAIDPRSVRVRRVMPAQPYSQPRSRVEDREPR